MCLTTTAYISINYLVQNLKLVNTWRCSCYHENDPKPTLCKERAIGIEYSIIQFSQARLLIVVGVVWTELGERPDQKPNERDGAGQGQPHLKESNKMYV